MHISSCCVPPFTVSLEHLLLFFPSDESPQEDAFGVLLETQVWLELPVNAVYILRSAEVEVSALDAYGSHHSHASASELSLDMIIL